MACYDMKDRQEVAAIERVSFTKFSISDIIFGRHASLAIHWLLISSVPTTSTREVSSERRIKTSIPGAHQESISIDEGVAGFLSNILVYSIPVELRQEDSLRTAILSPSRSSTTKSGLGTKLTILLSVRHFFLFSFFLFFFLRKSYRIDQFSSQNISTVFYCTFLYHEI